MGLFTEKGRSPSGGGRKKYRVKDEKGMVLKRKQKRGKGEKKGQGGRVYFLDAVFGNQRNPAVGEIVTVKENRRKYKPKLSSVGPFRKLRASTYQYSKGSAESDGFFSA